MPIPELDAPSFVAIVRRAISRSDGVIFLAVGGFGGAPDRDRVGAFAVRPRQRAPKLLADAWLARSQLDEVRQRLGDDRDPYRELSRRPPLGGWDVMWATRWQIVWVADGAAFTLWERNGPIAEVVERRINVRGHPFDLQRLAAVHAYCSEDLGTHGVRLVLSDGAQISLVEKKPWEARVDVTYDGINVLADMSWAVQLTEALARSVKVHSPSVEAHDLFTRKRLL